MTQTSATVDLGEASCCRSHPLQKASKTLRNLACPYALFLFTAPRQMQSCLPSLLVSGLTPLHVTNFRLNSYMRIRD